MPGSITLELGQQVLVTASFKYADGLLAPTEPAVWVSSDTTVATVTPAASNSPLATVTAVSPGTATVTSTWQSLTDSVAVTVVGRAPTSLTLTLGNPTGP